MPGGIIGPPPPGVVTESDPVAEGDLSTHRSSTDHDAHNDGRYGPLVGPPAGAAGGVLNGTFPSPGLAPNVVGHAQMSVTDPVLEGDLSLASDAGPTTPSRRSSPYRCAVGSWRLDPLGRAFSPAILVAGYVNLLTFMPIWVPSQETWDQIGIRVNTNNGGVGVTLRAGLWTDTGDGAPAANGLVWDGGQKALVNNAGAAQDFAWTIATDHATAWQTISGYTASGSVGQVAAGLYWLGLVLQSTPSTYPTLYQTGAHCPFIGSNTHPIPAAVCYTQSGVSGALPTSPSGLAIATTATGLSIGARVASRP